MNQSLTSPKNEMKVIIGRTKNMQQMCGYLENVAIIQGYTSERLYVRLYIDIFVYVVVYMYVHIYKRFPRVVFKQNNDVVAHYGWVLLAGVKLAAAADDDIL